MDVMLPWIEVLLGVSAYIPLIFIGVSRRKKLHHWSASVAVAIAVAWPFGGASALMWIALGQFAAFGLHFGKWQLEVVGDMTKRERDGHAPLLEISEFQAAYSLKAIYFYRKKMNVDPISREYLFGDVVLKAPWADEAPWGKR